MRCALFMVAPSILEHSTHQRRLFDWGNNGASRGRIGHRQGSVEQLSARSNNGSDREVGAEGAGRSGEEGGSGSSGTATPASDQRSESRSAGRSERASQADRTPQPASERHESSVAQFSGFISPQVHQEYPNVRRLSLGRDAESGDRSHSGFRSGSKWAVPFRSVLSGLFQRVVLQEARLKSRRILHRGHSDRIQQQQKTTSGTGIVWFEQLRESPALLPAPDSRTERRPYILGIQTLEKVRPSVRVAELELFLSGWFLADRWYARMLDSRCDKEIPSGSNSMPSSVVQQSTKT
jgi:hypothetical protein